MSICETCEIRLKKLCPGKDGGSFCTDLVGEEDVEFHPGITDPQNAAYSCETRDLYEQPALQEAREQ